MEENVQEDILDSDRKEYAVSRSLLKQRVLLITLTAILLLLTGLAAMVMLSFYGELRAWENNSFAVAFRERDASFQEMLNTTDNEMKQFKDLVYSLENLLDNQTQVALLTLLSAREKENRMFIKKLIKSTHRLAIQVRGARTWYEQYADKLDRLVNSSHLRQRKLKELQASYRPLYKVPETITPAAMELGDLFNDRQ